MSTFPLTADAHPGLRAPRLSRGGKQVAVFLLAYLAYSAARWLTVGNLPDATANARWIVDLERNLDVEVEGTVQQALTGTAVLWVLNHLYLAAQLIVVPGALFFLYKRSKPAYERLRN